MRTAVARLATGLAAFAAWSAAAQGHAPARLASITLENDFFAGYDQHYTNGVQLAFLVDRRDLPGVLRDAPPVSWSRDPQVVFAIGQRQYTPANTDDRIPDPRERPYAGWLYGLLDVKTASGEVVDHVTASLGIVGPAALGRETQDATHRLFHTELSKGWDSQVGNELAVLVGFERAWPRVMQARFGRQEADLAVRVGGALGNVFTYASTGAVVRYGRNLPSDLPATHISLGPPRDGYRGTAEVGWYVWTGIDARAVARNIFIDGNTFRDGPHVAREPFGWDWQLGAAISWPTARIGFTFVQRSREFEAQNGHDRFGQLALSFAY